MIRQASDRLSRRALVRGPHDIELLEAKPDALSRDGVRVEVAYAGICGSELHQIHRPDAYGAPAPQGFGHEYSGVVSEVGAEVDAVAIGDEVTCVPRVPCLRCTTCRMGRLTACTNQARPSAGAWGDEIVVSQRFPVRLPAEVPLRTAALCEPLSCSLRAVDLAQAPPGHLAVVIGGGPIGLLTALLAARSGAREVLVSEPRAYRRALAEAIGAQTVDPVTDNLQDAVRDVTSGLGAEVVYEAVGSPESLSEAVELLAPGGTAIVLGVAPPRATAAVRPWRLFERELTIRAAWGHETTFQRALEWIPSLDLASLITHEYRLSQLSEALEVASSGDCGKVMLVPAAERIDHDARMGRR